MGLLRVRGEGACGDTRRGVTGTSATGRHLSTGERGGEPVEVDAPNSGMSQDVIPVEMVEDECVDEGQRGETESNEASHLPDPPADGALRWADTPTDAIA
jgi:hypothetical protein